MLKRVLIILGHPNPYSYCGALASAYEDGARGAGADVQKILLSELAFDPNLKHGYDDQVLEPDLIMAQEKIQWAEHLVFVYPTWWGTMPALLKGFVDRTFLPGYAFKYRKGYPLWDKLLRGRSARLIVTMDAPPWYFRFWYGRPGHRAMKQVVLEFCGIGPVRVSSIGSVKMVNEKQRKRWLLHVQSLGRKMR
ncbi:MAG: NAD(P)H-dependent oxidoreductase [Merismopedia sp. SIO2A8]|nr:NAD(P)H-dependent oxidoreductase [Merismopedia sp. SIO2A8]